jgi:L-fuconolactonase
MRIDAHHHFWRRARGDYRWLREDEPALQPLLRDFEPADLVPLLERHRIAQTVLVQAADSTDETRFMLSLAEEHAFIGGVVGWVDVACSEAVDRLHEFARHPKFKGVRPMLQDLDDVQWIARAPQPEVIEALVALGLRFDALVKPQHLPALLRFVARWPELPVVIDHAAKPPLAQPGNELAMQAWRDAIGRVARHPLACCKVSGLLNEMAPVDRQPPERVAAVLLPVWHTLLDTFGPARLMWGSDWPVLTLAGDHDRWIAASDLLLAELSADERAQVLHGTARRFYGLQP